MATELGELSDFIDGGGLAFTFNGERFEVDPSAQTVLKFQKTYRELMDKNELDGENMLRLGAELLGGTLDGRNMQFKGGVASKLIDAGASFEQVNRVIMTAITKYWLNDDAASEYYRTGDMGKALSARANRGKGSTAPDATQTA